MNRDLPESDSCLLSEVRQTLTPTTKPSDTHLSGCLQRGRDWETGNRGCPPRLHLEGPGLQPCTAGAPPSPMGRVCGAGLAVGGLGIQKYLCGHLVGTGHLAVAHRFVSGESSPVRSPAHPPPGVDGDSRVPAPLSPDVPSRNPTWEPVKPLPGAEGQACAVKDIKTSEAGGRTDWRLECSPWW